MDSDLFQLVYQSNVPGALRPEDRCRIETVSRDRNARHGLTGILVLFGDRFVGILEGHRPCLLARMERIAADPRHETVEILREAPIAHRRFKSWSFFEMPAAGADTTIPEAGALFARKISRGLYRNAD